MTRLNFKMKQNLINIYLSAPATSTDIICNESLGHDSSSKDDVDDTVVDTALDLRSKEKGKITLII